MSPQGSKTPRCSVVIRAYNEEKHLGNLLESIQRQTVKEVEIVLVDSGSTDDTLAIAGRYPVKIEHIQPEEFTFGRSLNIGIRAASAEILVLASAHVLPMDEQWLEHLVAPFEDDKVALAYGKQRGGDCSQFSEDQHWQRWFPEHTDLDQPHPYCNNANAALRKSLWEQQPYDEDLTGLEDLAWCSWAKEQGYKVAYVAEAGVFHFHNESRAQILNRHRREAIALKRILPNSDFSFWNFLSMWLRRTFSDWRAAAQQDIFLRKAYSTLCFRFLQYWGVYRGYREAGYLTEEMKQVFYYPPGWLETRRHQEAKGHG